MPFFLTHKPCTRDFILVTVSKVTDWSWKWCRHRKQRNLNPCLSFYSPLYTGLWQLLSRLGIKRKLKMEIWFWFRAVASPQLTEVPQRFWTHPGPAPQMFSRLYKHCSLSCWVRLGFSCKVIFGTSPMLVFLLFTSHFASLQSGLSPWVRRSPLITDTPDNPVIPGIKHLGTGHEHPSKLNPTSLSLFLLRAWPTLPEGLNE